MHTLVAMADERELWSGRCALVSYPDEVARRSVVRENFNEVLGALVRAGHVTTHSAALFARESALGIIYRVRRPGVILSSELAGPLWPEDARPGSFR
ncbi:hypothetical protein J2805_004221 [Arthrobacter oryzae]|nr:hypothetical protein [Arthrobacter oryzae]